MNTVINICDKCGRVVDFPDELKIINVSYIRDTNKDRQLQLCSVCKQEFVKTVEDFMKANVELGAQSSADLAKHILEKKEDGGELKNEK